MSPLFLIGAKVAFSIFASVGLAALAGPLSRRHPALLGFVFFAVLWLGALLFDFGWSWWAGSELTPPWLSMAATTVLLALLILGARALKSRRARVAGRASPASHRRDSEQPAL